MPLARNFGATVEVLDVDTNCDLQERYDLLVPVLLHGDRELCHYFLDVDLVGKYLSSHN